MVARPDVLGCGAGLVGLGAAVAAACSGAKTMVVERMGFAGGRRRGFRDARADGRGRTRADYLFALQCQW